MADDLGKQIGNLWDRFRKKASDALAQPSAALVRGKIVAYDVFDDNGAIIVGAGHLIDDAVLDRATAAGKIPEIVAAVTAAQTQDLKERVVTEYERTPDGEANRNLADSDEYLEARRYIRFVAAVEVTDIRGNVLLPAGKVIEDEDVRKAREAGQLAALIYSAQQSAPPDPSQPVALTPTAQVLPSGRRTALPLAETFEEVGEDTYDSKREPGEET